MNSSNGSRRFILYLSAAVFAFFAIASRRRRHLPPASKNPQEPPERENFRLDTDITHPPGKCSNSFSSRFTTGTLRLLALFVAFTFISLVGIIGYNRLFPGDRPGYINDGKPVGQIAFDVELDDLHFVVNRDTTVIRAIFAEPEELVNVSITYLTRYSGLFRNSSASKLEDGNIVSPALKVFPSGSDRLTLTRYSGPALLSLTLIFSGNTSTTATERLYLRSASWEIVAREIHYSDAESDPEFDFPDQLPQLDGIVQVTSSGYNIEKIESGGRLGQQASEGDQTIFQLSPELNLIKDQDAAVIPTVSIDLLDLQKIRDRESISLLEGAILGVAGALLVEILLAVTAGRSAENSHRCTHT